MCIICSALQDADPSRHLNLGPADARIDEIGDARSDTSTVYTMSVGDSFHGLIDNAFETDWVRIELTAGQTYTISQLGLPSGQGTLPDSYLRFYNQNGQQIAFDDDSGLGLEAQITVTANMTGTYYISNGAYGSNTGSYTLTVEEAPSPAFGTLDELADFTANYWGPQYVWDTSTSNVIRVNLEGLNADGRQLARWAMDTWEMVADIDFVEVTSNGDINAMDDQSGAFAYAPNSGNGLLNVSQSWLQVYGTTLDSYSFQTYIHELGHAIGLYHQGPYNGSANFGVDNVFANDSWQLSVMSYFSQTENTYTNATYAFVGTAMMADILAIQELYGAPNSSSATAGNTTYGVGSNLGNYLDQILERLASGQATPDTGTRTMAWTIYDHSGLDTLDFSTYEQTIRLDMREEQFSDFANNIGIMGIARGTIIEDAITGLGSDTVTGNDAANRIDGGEGNDEISGLGGNDLLLGGAGDDSVSGGTGSDTLEGGLGDDILDGGFGINTASFASVAQAVSVMLAGIPGTGSTPADLKHAVGQGSDTLISIHNVTGSSRQDTIIGDSNDNVLSGRGSRDLINGDGGNDKIEGGRGNDSLYGGLGRDQVFGGSGNDVMNGGSGPDMLFSGVGDDIMDAGVGRDTLKGGSGRDIMTGGGGPDTFVFCDVSDSPTTAADRITDFVAGADRIDFDDLVTGTLTFETGNGHTGGGTASVYLSVTGSGNTNVFADADGDGSSDMRIILLGSTGLGATDFIL